VVLNGVFVLAMVAVIPLALSARSAARSATPARMPAPVTSPPMNQNSGR